MKTNRILFILFLILPVTSLADSYQEKSCSDISKNLRGGDIIPTSCMDIFKSESDFFKQVASKNQNLGVWLKKNLIFIHLEKKIKGKWSSEQKLIGGKELSSGQILDFDISPEAVFENTFEINILIEEESRYKIITHLSSQKNGQKPRVAFIEKSQNVKGLNQIFRGNDRRIWLASNQHHIYSIDAAANSHSQNEKDHPVVKKSPFSSNAKIDFISSDQGKVVMLSSDNLLVLTAGKEQSYLVKEIGKISKFNTIRLEVKANRLIIRNGDQTTSEYVIQIAAE